MTPRASIVMGCLLAYSTAWADRARSTQSAASPMMAGPLQLSAPTAPTAPTPAPTAPAPPPAPATPAPPAEPKQPPTPIPTPVPSSPTAPTPTAPAAPTTQTTPTPPAAPPVPPTTTVTSAPPAPKVPDPEHESDEEEGEPKLSLPTEADRAAWRRSGFRLGLGAVYGELAGLRGAPSGRLLGAKLRIGLRLDSTWSIVSSFEYVQASRSGGLSGLRFAGTLDPTWHVLPNVAVAVGFGFGGIVEARNTGRADAEPFPAMLETSYTFPDARTPIASCSGVGTAGLVRVEWSYVLGPRSQLAIAAEIVGQWTGCVSDTNRFEPDTGTSIVRRQWWPHTGGTLTVGFTWR